LLVSFLAKTYMYSVVYCDPSGLRQRIDCVDFFSVIAQSHEQHSSSTASQVSYNSDDSSGPTYDYTERRSLPISIPEYRSVDSSTEKYVVSVIFMEEL